MVGVGGDQPQSSKAKEAAKICWCFGSPCFQLLSRIGILYLQIYVMALSDIRKSGSVTQSQWKVMKNQKLIYLKHIGYWSLNARSTGSADKSPIVGGISCVAKYQVKKHDRIYEMLHKTQRQFESMVFDLYGTDTKEFCHSLRSLITVVAIGKLKQLTGDL